MISQTQARKTDCKGILYIFSASLVVLLLSSINGCKIPDDNRLKIGWHNLIARDNIWFNANEKLRLAKQQLRKQQEDDFDKILDVYPYGSESQRKGLAGDMDAVMTKASKVIIKHKISRWIDNSYFLVGQAQFFKGEYYAAIETFQYFNTKFKTSKLKPEAMLWIIKSNLYAGKTDEAEAAYTVLKSDPKWPKKWQSDLDAIGAHIDIKQGKYLQAAHLLKKSINSLNFFQRYEKARYSYILAQLYQKVEKYDSANYYFRRVIRYNPPYDMAFNAKMNLAKAYNAGNPAEARRIKRQLKNMLRDDKNISFYDQIYYELGLIALREKNIPEAIKNFKLAAISSQKNNKQKALAYLALADLYFNQKPRPDYRNAQAYFDSTALFIPKESPEYTKIIDKKEVLSELIKNLLIIANEDSLLKLSEIPHSKLDHLLDKMLEDRKNNKAAGNGGDAASNFSLNPNTSDPNGTTPFTNSTMLSTGAQEFVRKWGDRKNTDYWRYSARAAEFANQTPTEDTKQTNADAAAEDSSDNPIKDSKIYKDATPEKKQILNSIPFSEKAKKESDKRIADAMCDNGAIYFDKLNDLEESEEVLKKLMLLYPKYEKMDKVLYYLYKISKANNDDAQADKYKKTLIENYPKSTYARILGKQDVGDKYTEKNKEIIQYYETTYDAFTKGNYTEVKKRKIEADKKFPSNGMQPKFDFLFALATGKTDSVSAFEKQLKLVESKYPNTDESDRSRRMLEAIERYRSGKLDHVDSSKEEKKQEAVVTKPKGDYKNQYSSRYFYVLVVPIKGVDLNNIKNGYSDFNSAKHTLEGLEGRMMVFDDEHQIYRIVEFKDKASAANYVREVEENAALLSDMNLPELKHFAISEDNFLILYNTKDLDGYIQFYSKSF